MLLMSNSKASRAMLPIADLLFKEAQAFGKLSIDRGLPESRLESYVELRLGFTKFFLEILEQYAELCFDQDSIPYIYNTNPSIWGNDLPIAGYTSSNAKPTPSQVLTTLMMSWNLEISKKSTASRLLCASLWMIDKYDLATALDYLFNLLKEGYIINTDSLSWVIIVLLLARSHVNSDKQVVSRLTGNKKLDNPSSWKAIEFTLDWLESEDKKITEIGLLSSLINKVLDEIEVVRQTDNWDDWLLGQKTVGGLISTVLDVYRQAGQQPSVGLKSILSQFEEILADVPNRLFLTWEDFHPYTSFFGLDVVAVTYKSKIGEGWEDRLYHERLLVPAKIRPLLFSSKKRNLPSEWNYLSWKLVNAFSTVFLPGKRDIIMRSTYFEINSLIKAQSIQDFFKNHNIIDSMTQSAILETEYLGRIPKSWFSGPPLPPYPKDEITNVISDAHFELCMQELQEGQDAAFSFLQRKKYQDEIGHLNSLLLLYPWSAVVYHELSIAHDEDGDHETALAYIIPAVFLDVTNPERWKSLAVILNRLGHPEEANIASAIKNMMLDRSSKNL